MPSLRDRSLLKEVDKFTPWKEGDPHAPMATRWMKSKIKKEKRATNKKERQSKKPKEKETRKTKNKAKKVQNKVKISFTKKK